MNQFSDEEKISYGESAWHGGGAPGGIPAPMDDISDSKDGKICALTRNLAKKNSRRQLGMLQGVSVEQFIKEDLDRTHTGMCSFTRICLEVDLSKWLLDQINLKFGNFQHSQPLDYENMTFRCRNYRNPSHLQASCPMNKKPKKRSGSDSSRGWGYLDPGLVDVATFKEEPYNSSTEDKAEESVEKERLDAVQDYHRIIVVSGAKRGHSLAKSYLDQESLSDNWMASENLGDLFLVITTGN
ncbi:hypothetical protein KI387_021363, partial [Taxus chinensis]